MNGKIVLIVLGIILASFIAGMIAGNAMSADYNKHDTCYKYIAKNVQL